MKTHSKSGVVQADCREERARGSLRKSLHIFRPREAEESLLDLHIFGLADVLLFECVY